MVNNELKLILSGFIFGFFMISSVYGQNGQVTVEKRPEYRETVYKILAGDQKEIALTTYQTELNKEILDFRSDSGAPFKEQLQLLSALLKTVLSNEKDNHFKTFYIGRMATAFGRKNLQLSKRLALAAHVSDLWNNELGKPFSGHENTVSTVLANQFSIYSELSDVFSKQGISIRVSAIEKVLVAQAENLPFAGSLKAEGIGKMALLPYDGMTWFSMTQNKINKAGEKK